MTSLTLVLVFLVSPPAVRHNCLDCHLKLEDSRLAAPARAMREDVHIKAGFTCASCHGGDPEIEIHGDDYRPAMDPRKGYVRKIEPARIPETCGRCHADAAFMHLYDPNFPVDQLAQYRTSVHGQKLRAGATGVAHCGSCHSVHGIVSVKDPHSPVYATRIPETCGRCHADPEHMKAYEIPTDQLELYRKSVHGRALLEKGDLGAPTCNSCHGNHGAAPPGVSAVSHVCGTCHAVQKELFAQSLHKAVFDEAGQPECETCHGNHAVEPVRPGFLGVGEGGICVECHDNAKDATYQAAKALAGEIDGLRKSIGEAQAIVARAAEAGMEVSDAELTLIDAHEALVQAGNLTHAASMEKLKPQIAKGLELASTAGGSGTKALKELDTRRKGLALSLIFILVLAVGLYLKIRQIDEART